MRVAIEPRKATDRGGYYCMPLRVNVPTGRKDWKLTKCPECGAQCWELPLAEVAKAQGTKGLCTMCALKKVNIHTPHAMAAHSMWRSSGSTRYAGAY